MPFLLPCGLIRSALVAIGKSTVEEFPNVGTLVLPSLTVVNWLLGLYARKTLNESRVYIRILEQAD